jgi:ribonuclease HI
MVVGAFVDNPESSPAEAGAPHYLLFSESIQKESARGQWRFVLQSIDGTDQLEATDAEPEVQGDRLELLAVVRGLEALAQPSRVTLVTPSKYVNRGLAFGLKEWRSNDWQWEHFGEMVPVKNCDLWQRVDQALSFHQLECRTWRFDPPHALGPSHARHAGSGRREATSPARRWKWRFGVLAAASWWEAQLRGFRLRLAQSCAWLLPVAWLQ